MHAESRTIREQTETQQASGEPEWTPHSLAITAAANTMAAVQQGEKQLFEKFWRGTFKAVASPRPESIIVASITARKAVISTEASTCQARKAEEQSVGPADTRAKAADRNRSIQARQGKQGSRHQTRSLCFDEDLSPHPAPKGKKKKKKSERKRRKKRCPSYNLSPVRKKKKKKSSKKRKKHRSPSKKRRHSCSIPKRKRRDEKKHKKRSRSHAHRRRHYWRSESESSTCRSSSADSRRLHRSAQRSSPGSPAGQPRHRKRDSASVRLAGSTLGPAAVSACEKPLRHRSAHPTNGTIVHSGSGGDIYTQKRIHHDILCSQDKGQQDSDSGNDTSSPPSTKTGSLRSKVNENEKALCRTGSPSHEKSQFTDGDNASDSGNSVTSYSSFCKPLLLDSGSATASLNGNGKRPMWGKSKAPGVAVGSSVTPPHRRSRTRSRSSLSKSGSSRNSQFSDRYSHSRSLSSGRSYSRSPSSEKSRSVESGTSRRSPSYSRYSPCRTREVGKKHRKYSPSGKEAKRERERCRKRSYSPMRKRRRDSPSHLEARRITSARKRPIPYYRPSPSSSSRSTSCSSWCSIFSRSRGRGRSRSRSCSRSYSTYRSYSRCSSWSSLSGSSHSHSCYSVNNYSRARR